MTRANDSARSGVLLAALAVLLGLACAGGSDSPTALAGAGVAEVEHESFQLVNSARRDSGVRPLLELDETVARIAREHSEAMRDEAFFGHSGSDGGLEVRLRAGGVPFSAAGENLARLSSVPDPAREAHARFMSSPEHREVILDRRFRLAGVGVARSGSNYWLTQIYIAP